MKIKALKRFDVTCFLQRRHRSQVPDYNPVQIICYLQGPGVGGVISPKTEALLDLLYVLRVTKTKT